MISTTLVPSLMPGGSMVMLRMRSVRSQPVAPSNVAPAIPAPVILRKSLRVRVRFLTKQERTTPQCDLQAERTATVNPSTWRAGRTVRMNLMRSIMAVGIGLLLALVLGLLVVQGIYAPVLTRLFGLERAGPATLPLVLLVFAAAFSFYFGGMAASYKAPSRHRLHGVLVAPTAFVISSALNLALGKGLLPGVEGVQTVVLVIVFLLISTAASYVGALRGEALYVHNQKF